MEVSEESIRLNHPIPPMPKFDLKSSSNMSSTNASQSVDIYNNLIISSNNIPIKENDFFAISDDDTKKYTILFNKNKDLENKMSINKSYQMWTTAGVSNDLMKKILLIVPLLDRSSLNFNEFKVIFHLIYKSVEKDVPEVLPGSLKKVLGINDVPQPSVDKNSLNTSDQNLNSLQMKNSKSMNNLGTGANVNVGGVNNFGLNNNNLGVSHNNLVVNNNNPIGVSNNNIGVINNNLGVSNNNLGVNNNNFKNDQIKYNNDLEANLLSEFNLKNDVSIKAQLTNSPNRNNYGLNPNSINNINNNNIQQINTIIPSKVNNQPSNNLPLQSFSQNVTEKFTNIHKETVQENQFLNKVLDDDNILLSNILEDIEKINRTINLVNEKNKFLKEQIIEIRRRINTENDSLTKAISTLNQRTNEFFNNQGSKYI
jgi:hypothetical protein